MGTDQLHSLFGAEKPIIGMIHLMPLVGFPDYPGFEAVLQKALRDLEALEGAGADGILVENNYDIPHKVEVDRATVECMLRLTRAIVQRSVRPVGVSVLWNDYKAALTIAKRCGGRFVRVPVFVDRVRTAYGDVTGDPKDVLAYRASIGADKVQIWTDIHVKHSELLNRDSIEESAQQAVRCGSDALILTGKWTADPPQLDEIRRVKRTIGTFPILVGSGATMENVGVLMDDADGIIVGTALKTGRASKARVNRKRYEEEISERKARQFVRAARMHLLPEK